MRKIEVKISEGEIICCDNNVPIILARKTTSLSCEMVLFSCFLAFFLALPSDSREEDRNSVSSNGNSTLREDRD